MSKSIKIFSIFLASVNILGLCSPSVYAMKKSPRPSSEEDSSESSSKRETPSLDKEEAASENFLSKLLQLTPTMLLESYVYNYQNQINKELKKENKINKKKKKDPETRNKLALTYYFKEGKKEQALELWQENARKEYPPSMVFLGNLWRDNQDINSAMQWYILAFQVHWENTGQHFSASIAVLEKIKDEKAKEFLRRINQDYPNEHQANSVELRCAFADLAKQCSTLHKESTDSAANLYVARLLLKTRTPGSIFNVADLYIKNYIGRSLSTDEKNQKIKSLCEKSKTPDALYTLGSMYLKAEIGTDLSEKDRVGKARHYFEKSGIPDALNSAAMLFLGGAGTSSTDKEITKRLEFLCKDSQDPDKLFALGRKFFKGEIGKTLTNKERKEKAKQWLEKAGTPEALMIIWKMYIKNENEQDLDDKTKVEIVDRLSSQINDPKFLCHLGSKFMSNKLGSSLSEKERIDKAISLFEKSKTAEALNDIGVILSMHNSQYEEAIPYFEKSGLPSALCNLGAIYLYTMSKEDHSWETIKERALPYFKKANTSVSRYYLAKIAIMDFINKDQIYKDELQKGFSLLEAALLEGHRTAHEDLDAVERLLSLEEKLTEISADSSEQCTSQDLQEVKDSFKEKNREDSHPSTEKPLHVKSKDKQEKIKKITKKIDIIKGEIKSSLILSQLSSQIKEELKLEFETPKVKEQFRALLGKEGTSSKICENDKLRDLLTDIFAKS